MKEFDAELNVMGRAIELNHFVEQFLSHTVMGAASSLKGVDDVKTLEIRRDSGELTLTVNGGEIELSQFPHLIIDNTLRALLSSLKDVENTESFVIKVRC